MKKRKEFQFGSARLLFFVLFCTLSAAVGEAQKLEKAVVARPSSRVVIVPLDDRPATTQFAEMIGRIGDAETIFPPPELLGTFLQPGKPERIAEWLLKRDFKNVDAVILSVDMLAYGGFMASRTSAAPLRTALKRLEIIKELKRKNPRLPIYAFNVVRRVALSASAANRAYRDKIARWAVLAHETGEKPDDAKLKAEFQRLEKELAPELIEDYLRVRRRNLQINFALLDLARAGVVNKLLLLQDDAHAFGLHRRDQAALRKRIGELGLKDAQAALYNGADEGASVLLSRTVLAKHNFKPRVGVVYSSEAGRRHLGDFEDQPIEESVLRQLESSGAEITNDAARTDYTLYVNAPRQTEAEFQDFLQSLIADIKAGRRVAIADVLYKVWGGGDQRLVEALAREKMLDRVIGYASWGTPGNALGTVIPGANLYVLARRKLFDSPERAIKIEAAQIKFLFHRWTGDYGFHTLVRQDVNRYARQTLRIEVDEFNRSDYDKFNQIIAERMRRLTEKFFAENFKNRSYPLPSNRALLLTEMRNLEIRLPWARTFEIFMDYDFDFNETENARASRAAR